MNKFKKGQCIEHIKIGCKFEFSPQTNKLNKEAIHVIEFNKKKIRIFISFQ